MAYKAYLNNQIFFSTDAASNELALSAAKLSLRIGTSGSFTFTVPSCNPAYGSFHRLTDFVDVYRDGSLVFSGRVYSVKETFDTQQQIVCEGLLAVLNDSVFRPVTFDGYLHNLVGLILANHNSQVDYAKQIYSGRLLVTNSECYREYQNYETSISRLQDLEKSFGGWMRVRKANGANYLDWYPGNIDGTSQRINFGENLLNITREENADGIITVLIPLGAADENNVRVDIKSVNYGVDYIEASAEYIQQYGYIVGSQVWDDVHEPQILKTKGTNWLNACLTPRITINATAVDLADAGYDVDAFQVGQKVRVWSEPHNIDGVWMDCVQQDIDLLNPAGNKLTLGTEKADYIKAARQASAEVKTSLEKIAAEYAPKTFMQAAINTATALITGNLGGHIRWNDTNGDGEPDEFLLMDTPDIETAVKVWRFNLAGLGFSSSGYDGPYALAMTMDGQIVADFITTGTLNADLLKTGTIRGQAGGSYWNLVTGDLHIEGQTEIDKSKVFVRQPTTPYYVGDLWVTGYNQNSAVAGYAVASYAVVENAGTSEGFGVIKTCICTRTTGNYTESDWMIVTDYIDSEALSTLSGRITSAEFEIAQNTADILERATSEELDAESRRITTAFEDIDGLNGRITAMASQVTTGLNKSKVFRSEPTVPYNVGDLWVTGTEPYTAIAGEAKAGDARCNWGRDIYVCTTARSSGSFTESEWIKATKYIDDSQLYGVRQEIRSAELSIDAANARIDLKADYTYTQALYQRIRTAEVNIDGANARIDLKAESSEVTELSERVTSAQISIDGLGAQISSTVRDLSTVEGRVRTAEGNITQLAQNKLDGSSFSKTNIINKINEGTSSGTSTISEARINLTAENLIKKINGSDVGTKINMSKIDIVANTLVDTINNNATHNISKITLSAANVIGTINGQGGSTTVINEAKIELTAENIAGKINDSSVTISASRINLSGYVTVSTFNNTQTQVNNSLSNVATKMQYALSASSSTAPETGWQDNVERLAWEQGQYVWTRTVTTKTKNNGSAADPTYSTPVCDKNLTTALSTAASAQSTANTAQSTANTAQSTANNAQSTANNAQSTANSAANAASAAQNTANTANSKATYRYGVCGTAAATAAKEVTITGFGSLFMGAQVTIYFVAGNTAADPTLNVTGQGAKAIHVGTSNGETAAITAPYFWKAGDTVTFTYNGTVWLMSDTTANRNIASWCYNNNTTLINGGMIAAGTVTAEKINVDELSALGATIGGFTIDTNSIRTGAKGDTATGSITLSKTNFSREIGNTSRSYLRFAIGSQFAVSGGGISYMSNAVITGGKIEVDTVGEDATSSFLVFNHNTYKMWAGSKFMGFEQGSQYYSWMGAEHIHFQQSQKESFLDAEALLLTSGKYQTQVDFTGFTEYYNYNTAKTSGVQTVLDSNGLTFKNGGDSDSTYTFWHVIDKDKASFAWKSGDTVRSVEMRKAGSGSSMKSELVSYDIYYIDKCEQASDRRLKKNILPLDPGRSAQFVYGLKPVEYNLNDDEEGRPKRHGMIAQDVEEALGGIDWGVVSEVDGYKALSYTEIIADLVATVQTLNERIKTLERRAANGS